MSRAVERPREDLDIAIIRVLQEDCEGNVWITDVHRGIYIIRLVPNSLVQSLGSFPSVFAGLNPMSNYNAQTTSVVPLSIAAAFVPTKSLLLRSKEGSGKGMPVDAHANSIARYQPMMDVTRPKPPAILIRYTTCSASAAVAACGRAKSAAARKEKRKIRQKSASAKGTFERMPAMKKTKLMRVL